METSQETGTEIQTPGYEETIPDGKDGNMRKMSEGEYWMINERKRRLAIEGLDCERISYRCENIRVGLFMYSKSNPDSV